MGSVKHLSTGAVRRLPCLARLGRAPVNELVADNGWVSALHATISWSNRGWILRDEQSRNGTWVNQQPLASAPVNLEAGQLIGLGQPEPTWLVIEADPPQTFARREADGLEIAEDEDGALTLPGAGGPVELRWCLEHGGWVVTEAGQDRPVRDRERLPPDGAWTLYLATRAETTIRMDRVMALDDVTLGFRLSRDLEHVALAVSGPDRQTTRWLSPRVAFWPLYLLAAERMREVELPAHEAGWISVEQLEQDSGLDRKKLDIYLGRARRSLEEVGLIGADQVVEVRRGQRRLNLPAHRLWVEGA